MNFESLPLPPFFADELVERLSVIFGTQDTRGAPKGGSRISISRYLALLLVDMRSYAEVSELGFRSILNTGRVYLRASSFLLYSPPPNSFFFSLLVRCFLPPLLIVRFRRAAPARFPTDSLIRDVNTVYPCVVVCSAACTCCSDLSVHYVRM